MGISSIVSRCAIAACLVAAGISATSTSTYAAPTARQLTESSIAAAKRQSFVRYVVTTSNGRVAINGYAGRTSGIQNLSDKGAQITTIVLPGAAYIRGNADALTSFAPLSRQAAAKYAGTWIQIPTSDEEYATAASGVTLTSALKNLVDDGRIRTVTREPDRTIRDQPALALRYSQQQLDDSWLPMTLYIRAAGKRLPLKLASKLFTVVLADWNVPVAVAAPVDWTPIAVARLG